MEISGDSWYHKFGIVYAPANGALQNKKGTVINMETFKEQLVTKKPTGADLARRIFTLVGVGLVILACCFFLPVSGEFWFFPVLIIVIAIYTLFKYFPYFYTEYEYIFTEGDLDIDKIIGKAKRSRLATFDMTKAEAFGRYQPDAVATSSYDTKVLACTAPTDPDTYYFIAGHPRLQRCLVVFNPNDMIRDGIKQYLPRTAIVNE